MPCTSTTRWRACGLVSGVVLGLAAREISALQTRNMDSSVHAPVMEKGCLVVDRRLKRVDEGPSCGSDTKPLVRSNLDLTYPSRLLT